MNKPQMTYFQENDTIHITLSEDPEAFSFELTPNVTVELNENGEFIGIEIIHASSFIVDSVVESVQAKVLSLSASKPT
ncbi:MAG: DUF2283 domain-containing protein [bacterium]